MLEAGKNLMRCVNIRVVGAWFFRIGVKAETSPAPIENDTETPAPSAPSVPADETKTDSNTMQTVDLSESAGSADYSRGDGGGGGGGLGKAANNALTVSSADTPPEDVVVDVCTALTNATTCLMGTIAAGAVVSALVGWLIFLIRKHKHMKNVIAKACLHCIICCVKKCLNVFTGAVYVRVSMFGMSYLHSAKETFKFDTVGDGGASACLDSLVMDDVFERLISIAAAIGGKSGQITGGIASVIVLVPLLANSGGSIPSLDHCSVHTAYFAQAVCVFFNFPGFFLVTAAFTMGIAMGWHIGRVMLAQATVLLESSVQCIIFFWYTECDYFKYSHPEVFARLQEYQAKRQAQLRPRCCCGAKSKPNQGAKKPLLADQQNTPVCTKQSDPTPNPVTATNTTAEESSPSPYPKPITTPNTAESNPAFNPYPQPITATNTEETTTSTIM